MKGTSLNLRWLILNYLPTVDMVSHCILCCLSQTWSANLELFVLPKWTFFICSDRRMPWGLPISLKYCFPHSHRSQYITLLVSDVETLGVVILGKLPIVLQEQKTVDTQHILISPSFLWNSLGTVWQQYPLFTLCHPKSSYGQPYQ